MLEFRPAGVMISIASGVILGLLVGYWPLMFNSCNRAALVTKPGDLNAQNPLGLSATLDLADMTWMEVRDRIKGGFSRVIVPTGGIEQNGPFSALNKHDIIVKEVGTMAAKILGGTVVAPVVSFVPAGTIDPPSGHVLYPGTLSVSSSTFQSLLNDIVGSLLAAGFSEICIIGDSADSQADIARVAAGWESRRVKNARVRHISEFYDYPEVRRLIRARGLNEEPGLFHEELAFSLQLLVIAPEAIRFDRRIQAGFTTLNGVSLLNREALTSVGREILESRAQRLAGAINSAQVAK